MSRLRETNEALSEISMSRITRGTRGQERRKIKGGTYMATPTV